MQVPFGLAQAPAYFQHLMNQVLDNCSFAMTYLDDIIIFSETEEQHLAHIEEIFKRLEAADLKMKRSKCDFFKKHIHYLGHLISADGIRPLKEKLDSIHDMPAPCNSKEVKQFLGLVGYYRKFVPCFAALSWPLSKLTCKDKVFEWTQECERSRNLDRSFRNIYIIPSFPTREQHAHSVQNARLRFNKLNQSYSCYPREKR